jgi:DNA repair photolyase
MKVSTILCKSALSPTGLMGYDYSLNPYRGCEHACSYCYAPYVIHEEREWGGFVDAKINIQSVLSKELRNKKKGVVGISTVTDPYQPIETRYELTRSCLEELKRFDFPICIQTKSTMVLRDLDLIKGFSHREVGFTITEFDDEARKKFEPGASSVEARISALEEISEKDIDTWVFLGPVLPYITSKDMDLEELIRSIKKSGAKYLMIDKLNFKRGMYPRFMQFIEKEFPDLKESYNNLSVDYFEDVRKKAIKICRKHGLRVEFCF